MADPDESTVLWQADRVADGGRQAIAKPASLTLWSLERVPGGRHYLLGLRTTQGERLVVQLQSGDILAIADAVLDDLERSAAPPPGVQ